MSRKARIQDITVHLRRRDGKPVTAEQAKKALWAAYRIARSGRSPSAELTHWTIEAIDWVNGGKRFEYSGEQTDEVLKAMGGILNKIGLAGIGAKRAGGIRVAVPNKEGEE